MALQRGCSCVSTRRSETCSYHAEHAICFPEAIEAVFPQTVVQTCIVHLIRQSLRYVPRRSYDQVVKDLRPIYTAVDADAAMAALEAFEEKWRAKLPVIQLRKAIKTKGSFPSRGCERLMGLSGPPLRLWVLPDLRPKEGSDVSAR